jgi:hypothetical protein
MVVPSLSTLSSFFEVFTVANLAYAGSTKFRELIKDDLLTLDKTDPFVEKQSQLVDAQITVIGNVLPGALQQHEERKRQFKEQGECIDCVIRYLGNYFPSVLQPTFLLCGLYCLMTLVAIGWSKQNDTVDGDSDLVLYSCLSASIPIILFAIVLFAKSFERKKRPRWPRPSEVIMYFFVFMFALPMLLWILELGTFNVNSSYSHGIGIALFVLAILAATAPYILYFARAFCYKYYKRVMYLQHNAERTVYMNELTSAMQKFMQIPNIELSVVPMPEYWNSGWRIYITALSRLGAGELDGEYLAQRSMNIKSGFKGRDRKS